MAKNLVLIGMSGCGKTTLGELLATKLGYNFVDVDEIIEGYGMTIDELFEQGEDSFRFVETMAVKQVTSSTNQVISTGGGVVTVSENIDYLKQNSIIVFVDRDLDRIKHSLENDKSRPLLAKGLSALDRLYDMRIDLYKEYNDFTVENNGSVYKSADEIAKKYKEYLEEVNA